MHPLAIAGPAMQRTTRNDRRAGPSVHQRGRRDLRLLAAWIKAGPTPARSPLAPTHTEGARIWTRSPADFWPAGQYWSPVAPQASAVRPPWAWPRWGLSLIHISEP